MLCPLAERRLQQVVQNDKDVYTLYSSPHGALIATQSRFDKQLAYYVFVPSRSANCNVAIARGYLVPSGFRPLTER